MLLENGRLIECVLVEANLTDAEHVRPIKVVGNDGNDLARQTDVLRLLGVDAEPAIVPNAELRGPLRLDLDKVPEVIAKPFRRATVEPGPECRLAHRLTAALGHALVVV